MTVHLGVDLAWRPNARTGLAVVDDTGELTASTSLVSNEDKDEFIRAHLTADRVVTAIDAPLIVSNPTGQSLCEREISRNFGRFHASAHTSNLSMPHFSPEPRGLGLAKRWNWSVDPADRRGPHGPISDPQTLTLEARIRSAPREAVCKIRGSAMQQTY